MYRFFANPDRTIIAKMAGETVTLALASGRHIGDWSIDCYLSRSFGSAFPQTNWSAFGAQSAEATRAYANLMLIAADVVEVGGLGRMWTEIEPEQVDEIFKAELTQTA